MDKIINLQILTNPANWLVIFVIFTMWAFVAHYAASYINQQSS